MRAEILTCGTELLTGAAVDTNSAYLSAELARRGVLVARHCSVADELDEFVAAVREACARCDLLIITGGLGPTRDDLTRDVLAAVTGRPLESDAEALASIEGFFAGIGRPMPESNRVQALRPRGATMLPNAWGTAPGLRVTIGRTTIFALPGVPREMKAMFAEYIGPFLDDSAAPAGVAIRAIRTFGAGESTVAEQIADLMAPGRNPAVGTTASEGVITVRIVANASSPEAAGELADRDQAEVVGRLGKLVFGFGDDTLPAVVIRELVARKATVATAESCTGGLIAKHLTDVPGSSAAVLAGFVTYSNEAKVSLLEVDAALIASHGAVSEAVAAAMAANCRRLTGATCALSCTGIAGPGGGTPGKPVGLVYVGLCGPEVSTVRECRFSDRLSREAIRDRTSKTVLNMLRLELASRAR